MSATFKSVVSIAVLLWALGSNPARPQNASPAAYGIVAKRPVFAGACKACPWGILAKVTAEAL